MLALLSLLLPMVRPLIYGICLLLAFKFLLMIFYPGSRESLVFFQLFRPVFPGFDAVTRALIFPLQWMSDIVHPWLPAGIGQYFPSAPAGRTLNSVGRLLAHIPGMDVIGLRRFFMNNDYTQDFRGSFQWLYLLGIPLWVGLFQLIERPVFEWILTQQNRQAALNRNPVQSKKQSESSIGIPSQPVLSQLDMLQTSGNAVPGLSTPPSPGHGNREIREVLRGLQDENSRLYNQREAIKSQFSHYFSPNVLKYMEQHRDQFQAFSNQKHVLSIMFCDIRNFTRFSQAHPPEETAAYLSRFFNLVNEVVIHQYEGTLNKLIGDALMAYWGFPLKNPDHAYVATQAAISILYAIEAWNKKQEGPPYEVGIGIYTGEVLVGNIGSQDFMDFTLVGDPVNLAARLEGATKALNSHLLISEETYRGLNERLLCRRLGPLEVKGWQGELYAYEPHYYRNS